MTKALIIDDERDICELIEMALMGQGITCDMVHNVKAAIKKLKENKYSFVICDVRLPDGDGLDLLAHVQKHYQNLPICMITAHGNMDMAISALKMGAFDFVNKPFDLKKLRSICQAALKEGQHKRNVTPENIKVFNKRNEALSEIKSKSGLIGQTQSMHDVRQIIDKVARSQAPVFISGESGTGKEIAARSIHNQSSRRNGPFIAVNCGAIPDNLVESEFFGYKKGSFTGANQDQDGLFVNANGGTLFLDEVADLPLAMQVKLLRAIQERAIRPIGGDKEESVDVRIISATHHSLVDRVAQKRFREDLFYRLNVIAMEMPPLRTRKEDIELLATYLLQRLAVSGGYPEASLSPNALAKLKRYSFPGNVRELENILERALTFVDGKVIDENDILVSEAPNDSIREEPLRNTNSAAATAQKDATVEDCIIPDDFSHVFADIPIKTKQNNEHQQEQLEQTEEMTTEFIEEIPDDLENFMQNMEKQLLLKALEDANYNKTKAAQMLGITFRAMRYKLKKLGIE